MLLNDDVKKDVKKLFEELTGNVELVLVTQELECQYCKETNELSTEIAQLSDKISLKILDFVKDKEEVEKLGVDKVPALVINDGKKDFRIRYYGVPSGYEFSTFLEAIKLVSTGELSLSQPTKDYLDSLTDDVHLQVFVTPTCPHCPSAVVTAYQMAYYCDKVIGDGVEVSEFPELGNKYSVMGVPRTVINETEFQEGAAPDNMIVDKIKASLA